MNRLRERTFPMADGGRRSDDDADAGRVEYLAERSAGGAEAETQRVKREKRNMTKSSKTCG